MSNSADDRLPTDVPRPPTPAFGSRRELLQGGICLATALSLSPATSAVEQGANQVGGADGCTLGFSTYGMKTMSTERAIQSLEEIGFDSLELAVRSGWDADSRNLSMGRRQSLRRQLADSRLRLTSLMEHVFPTSDRHQTVALERLRLAAGVAHDLAPAAPPHIQTVLGSGDFQSVKERLRDHLGAWLQLAEATKTTIAVKPHRGGVVSKPAEAAWLLDQLGKPRRLRMVFDYSHYAFRNLPMHDTIQTALPYTAYIAVKDAVQQAGKVVFQLPGQAGTIDFVSLIKTFVAGGYRGDINCEVSGMVWGVPEYDPVVAARKCYRHMAEVFRISEVARPA